jgi:hypothetical protein
MRPSGTCWFALAIGVAAPLAGCGSHNQSSYGDGGNAGTGGGMLPANVYPTDLLSDFEEGRAVILPLGTPARNGYWYSYNDQSASCLQSPAHGDIYYASTSATVAPGLSHDRALHANWNSCSTWGAGVGADFASAPLVDGGAVPVRPRSTYDLTQYTGVAFWAMAMPGSQSSVRLKMVMHASTQVEDGGTCDESVLGANTCGDEWGESFTVPSDGSWKAVTVRFSDLAFKQEGWGHPFTWNPSDVLGIQFQSVRGAPAGLYDFWIDDIYLLR